MSRTKSILIEIKFARTLLLVMSSTMLFLIQNMHAGDIEQILPVNSNFTIDGDGAAEIMRVQSDGLVGIGTITPNERLEVNGNIRMTDGNEAGNTVMVGDADGTASWADVSTVQDGTGTDDQNIEDLNLTGTVLRVGIENGISQSIDLAPLLVGTGSDDQQLTLEAGNILTLEDGGTVDLTPFLDNTDDQTITAFSLNNATNVLTLTLEDGGTETVDFSTILAAAGTDDQGIQGSSLAGSTLTIGIENGTSEDVNLSTLLDNTDEQDIENLTLVGTTLTVGIQNGASDTVDLSSLDNNGSDDQNIEDLALDGADVLTVGIEDGINQTVDLSSLEESAAIALVQTNLDTHVADDNDTDDTNELLTSGTLNGTDLELVDAGGTTTVDLSSLDNNGSDDQNIEGSSFATGTSALTIGIEDGTSQDVDLSDLEESAAIALVQTNLDTHVADDNDTDDTNELQTITSSDGSVTLTPTGNDYDLSVPVETVTTITSIIPGHNIAVYTNEGGAAVDIDETVTTLALNGPDVLEHKYTNEEDTETIFRSSPIVAFGKVSSAGTLQRGYGATITRNGTGNYTVTIVPARSSANYTIQLTILDSNGVGNDDYDISYSSQNAGSFVVQTGDNDNGGGDRAQRDSQFMFTVIDY